jgi:hypothetical protein
MTAARRLAAILAAIVARASRNSGARRGRRRPRGADADRAFARPPARKTLGGLGGSTSPQSQALGQMDDGTYAQSSVVFDGLRKVGLPEE